MSYLVVVLLWPKVMVRRHVARTATTRPQVIVESGFNFTNRDCDASLFWHPHAVKLTKVSILLDSLGAAVGRNLPQKPPRLQGILQNTKLLSGCGEVPVVDHPKRIQMAQARHRGIDGGRVEEPV